ncbi:hypothetical protein ORI20_09845 [Mycobacterium sp. CVI_P3]|uniref:DUF732 domain-containing protein n=1 Tax=Mycobacterium pinniadriaticum TaxID=2994102 RepID=A0ABT3SCA5_9MYCO|nr:hypothetical protein [Mycobacterium pinniadriaticum]MCX2930578.1 hypothetical protein [Mycobacterium pinniadriaticum]MCX2937002.1 hypothetical protein [Mycobacterium pinniadriaticum]
MSVRRHLVASTLLALAAPLAQIPISPHATADPVTPLSAAEDEYLVRVREVFSQYRDPTEFRSDGELLSLGRLVCDQRRNGLVGYEATLVTPAVVQLALVYLCPS